jgi:putative addiction module component (TIGR02574 family)
MRDQVAELAERGKELTPDERSRLVDMLLASLHEPAIAEVEAAWDAEVEQRLAAYERGDMPSVDGEEVLAKARRVSGR